jgi:hypothetical protein
MMTIMASTTARSRSPNARMPDARVTPTNDHGEVHPLVVIVLRA